jgi:hypothetical protein
MKVLKCLGRFFTVWGLFFLFFALPWALLTPFEKSSLSLAERFHDLVVDSLTLSFWASLFTSGFDAPLKGGS